MAIKRESDKAPATIAARETQRRVYSANLRSNANVLSALKTYAHEVRRDRWQMWMNFLRKFKSSYNTTFFGIFWAFALPLVPIGAYTLLAMMRVVTTTDDMPFLVYIALGVTLYAYVTAPIEQVMAAMKGEKALLSKTHIGVFSIILGRFGEVVFETLVRLGLIIILMSFLGGYPASWSSVLFLPLLGAVFLSSLGAGMLLAILNSVAADVEKVVSVIMRFGVFFSAVFFPMPTAGLMAQINTFNPFHTFVDGLRSSLVKGLVPDPQLLLITSAVGVFLFLLGITLFYKAEPHLRAMG